MKDERDEIPQSKEKINMKYIFAASTMKLGERGSKALKLHTLEGESFYIHCKYCNLW